MYAIASPQQDSFEATYRIFIGDDTTGEELFDADEQPLYGSDIVNFRFDVDLIRDFDESGFLDAPDIDILGQQVRMGEYDVAFDLNEDEELSAADRQFWITELVDTLPGDADLDGFVKFADFLSLSSSFGEEAGWANGDFDGNNQVQFPDFLLLSQNFGQTSQAIATVPEGSGSVFFLLLWGGTLLRGHGRKTDRE